MASTGSATASSVTVFGARTCQGTRRNPYRVWATFDVDNKDTARVLERVGMQREGTLRNWLMHPNISEKPRDCYCYSIVK